MQEKTYDEAKEETMCIIMDSLYQIIRSDNSIRLYYIINSLIKKLNNQKRKI